MSQGAVRLVLVTVAAAAGGSAVGTAVLVPPLVLLGSPMADCPPRA